MTRSYVACITNHEQVRDDLSDCRFSVSKLWNIGRYYIQQQWDEDDQIPGEAEVKSELKHHERDSDLHSQSSQRVLEELAEAFSGWYDSDDNANPPGYRKRDEDHPRLTVTWKQKGIKHDTKHGQGRLSKGWNLNLNLNLKDGGSDFIFVEYETPPNVEGENIQQVRAVWNGDEWELHLVCQKEIPDAQDDKTAGIDLGNSNYLAISYEDGAHELYPEYVPKQNKHYLTREEYQTEGENSSWKRGRKARRKLSRPKDHFLHTLSKHVVQWCVKEGVAQIAVSDPSNIHGDENGDSRNWGQSRNKKSQGWESARFTRMLEYNAEEHGIVVDQVDEEIPSKTCSCCRQIRESNRVERGLYVCELCETTMNADVNVCRQIAQNPPTGHMSNGWLAQPGVFLCDRESGQFTPRKRGDCKPSYPNARESHP
ncbi:MAG: transposase [Haloquadratum sp. J07HQX50]|nr:MAG: transposase [Haloquadratum sp. J07HQX50]